MMKKISLEETTPGKMSEETVDLKEAVDMPKKKSKKWLKTALGVVLVVLVVVGLVGGFLLISFKDLLAEKGNLEKTIEEIKVGAKEQDLAKVQKGVEETRANLLVFEQKSSKISWLKTLPFLGNFVGDMEHGVKAGVAGLEATELVVKALEPYADILGLAGAKQATQSGKTTMDRITFLVTTLDKIRPQFDQINEKLKVVKAEVDQIDENKYPARFQGVKAKETITAVKLAVDQSVNLMSDARPLLEQLPMLLGMNNDQFYLILFQNDAELRPTGGFLTAYGILKVSKGKISPVLSQDIYSLDNRLSKTEPAPEALVKYLSLPYGQEAKSGIKPQWRIRDMNLSPDYAVSMQKFFEYYTKVAGKGNLNGIMAIDTKVLADLLKIIGTVGVPEWGNFSGEIDKRCNCPQVVYRLEELADKPVSGTNLARKAVITPLMHSILLNAFQSPKTKLPLLVEAMLKSIYEKHLLVYLFDEKAQKAVEAFNLGGRIKDFSGDYFHLSDTSFSGSKANLFINEAVEQKIEVAGDGTVTRTVTVTYKNPAPASNCNLEKGGLCLNAPYRDWVRIYVPKGATLESSNGFESEIKTYEELGKTVFEGFYGDKYPLRPESSAKISFKYKLPFKVGKGETYKLLIQKQPGVDNYQYAIDFNGQKQEFELRTDKEIRF